jgi:hypothetical protein
MHPREFKHDVNLVWTNCMTYNADGSEYFNVALTFKKIFDERYSKTVKDDGKYRNHNSLRSIYVLRTQDR